MERRKLNAYFKTFPKYYFGRWLLEGSLIEQMKKLPWRVGRMKEIWMLYANLLGNLKDKNGEKAVKMIDVNSCDEQWIPWFVDIYIENPTGLHINGSGASLLPVFYI